MEKINRHNYEAYFLDYLEGNLSVEEKHDLLIFLEQNPDLRNELDIDLSEVSLRPADAIFENKSSLKVTEEELLSMATVDTWMIESVEGNLSASKQQELDDFVRRHGLEKAYTAYQSTILKPDLDEVFENKQKLKVATGIVIPMYMRVAAVAAVAVLIIGVALNQPGSTETAVQNQASTRVYAAKMSMHQSPEHTVENNDAQADQNNVSQQERTTIQKNQDREKTNNQIPENLMADGDKSIKQDTLKQNISPAPENDNIVKQHDNPDQQEMQEKAPDDQDDVALQSTTGNQNGIVTEEPYKIVTDAASNVTKREVYFTRDRNTATNEYVAYGFKIGGFEFERKK